MGCSGTSSAASAPGTPGTTRRRRTARAASTGSSTPSSVEGSMSQLRELLRLAAPLIAAQIGNQMMTLVDTAMVGRLGSTALAGVGIGGGLFFTITLLGFGIVLGMDAP